MYRPIDTLEDYNDAYNNAYAALQESERLVGMYADMVGKRHHVNSHAQVDDDGLVDDGLVVDDEDEDEDEDDDEDDDDEDDDGLDGLVDDEDDDKWYMVRIEDDVSKTNTFTPESSDPDPKFLRMQYNIDNKDLFEYKYDVNKDILYVHGKKNIRYFNLYYRSNQKRNKIYINRQIDHNLLNNFNSSGKTNFTAVDATDPKIYTYNNNNTETSYLYDGMYFSTDKKALEVFEPQPPIAPLWYEVGINDDVTNIVASIKGKQTEPEGVVMEYTDKNNNINFKYKYDKTSKTLYVQGKQNIHYFNLYSRNNNVANRTLGPLHREVDTVLIQNFNNNKKYFIPDKNNPAIYSHTTVYAYFSTDKTALEAFQVPTTSGGGKTKKRKLNKKRRHGITKQKRY